MYEESGFEYRGTQNLYADNTGWTDFLYYELLLKKGDRLWTNHGQKAIKKYRNY